MRKIIPFLLTIGILPTWANALSLDDALRATYTACIGIDDELSDLKKMAGINTAITAVGTAAGAGATITGVVQTYTVPMSSADQTLYNNNYNRIKNLFNTAQLGGFF